MMNKLILSILLAFGISNIYAQKQHGQYFLEEPVYGTIYYEKGAVIKGMLNYNMLSDDMELWESEKKLKIDNFNEIEYVGLGLIKFVTISGYYTEMLYDGDNIILGKRSYLNVKREPGVKAISKKKLNSILEKEGALPEGITLERKSEFYVKKIEEKNSSMFQLAKSKEEKANLLNFNKLFFKNSKEVNDFIKKNGIDFSNEVDMLKLCKFCDDL